MSNEWDEVAAEWDEAATVRAYADAALESFLEVALAVGFALEGSRACDFGCGTGLLTQRLVERGVVVDAIDSSPAMLARAQAKVDDYGWVRVRTSGTLPVAAEPYDLVVCSSVLAFVDDHPAMVAELASRLRLGGLFVQFDWEAEPDDPDHAGLTRTAIADALCGAGLVGGTVEPAFTIEAEGEAMRPLRAWGVRR